MCAQHEGDKKLHIFFCGYKHDNESRPGGPLRGSTTATKRYRSQICLIADGHGCETRTRRQNIKTCRVWRMWIQHKVNTRNQVVNPSYVDSNLKSWYCFKVDKLVWSAVRANAPSSVFLFQKRQNFMQTSSILTPTDPPIHPTTNPDPLQPTHQFSNAQRQ